MAAVKKIASSSKFITMGMARKPWIRQLINYTVPVLRSIFLVEVDVYSKLMEVIPVRVATSSITIEELCFSFSTHGLPETMDSDNASVFTRKEFQAFLRANEIKRITSAPYHPPIHGLAESAVQSFKNGLRKLIEGLLWTRLSQFLSNYRTAPHAMMVELPAELLMRQLI